jgi:hypothetical protein
VKDIFAIDPFWHLAEAVSLQEAAALIAGYDPHQLALAVGETDIHPTYPKYYPVIRALRQAVASGMLKAKEEWLHEVDEISEYEHVTDVLQVSETIVKIDDLKKWLSDKGVQVTFFFPAAKPDYLDRQHKCYSPKLAAAIRVWEAVNSDAGLMHGTTAKQAMMKWLRRHADHYGLTKDDGNPNEQGIEEIAKIANWDTKGGAPRTP